MTSNVHQLPCGRSEHEDYGCIDCSDYPCMLWKVARGKMKLPGEVKRLTLWDMERIVGIQRGDTIIVLREDGTGKEEGAWRS